MIDLKKWLKFELRSENASTKTFEEGFCKELFAIQEGISKSQVKIINNLTGIENQPVNGVAFQSKYLKNNWDWKQIKHSLSQILKKKEKLYPGLNKVYFYVKEIGSEKVLEEKMKIDGILQELKEIGVEIIFFAGWEVIWEDKKYYELQDYFTIPNDITTELKLIHKYIDNLFLKGAKEYLDVIEGKLMSLDNNEKAKYYLCLAKHREFLELFQDEKENRNKKYEYNLKAYEYKKTKDTLFAKCRSLYELGETEEAKQIMNSLIEDVEFNNYIYGFHLIIEKDKFTNFEEFLLTVKKRYIDDEYVKGVLGNIYKNMGGTHIDAFEKYYGTIDLSKIEKFCDKVTHFQIWFQYLYEKYGLNNITKEAKVEFKNFSIFIDSILLQMEGKELSMEQSVYNTKAFLLSSIEENYEKAEYFFQKALEKKDSGYIRMNRILNIQKMGIIEEKVIKELEYIVNNFDYLLSLDKENSAEGSLFQAHPLLAEQYFLHSKRLELQGNHKSDTFFEKGINVLFDFKEKYYDQAKLKDKRNFGLVDIQSDPRNRESKVLEYLEKDDYMLYNLLAYNFLKEDKFLDRALEIYNKGKEKDKYRIFDLAKNLLRANRDSEYFEIINREFENFEDKEEFKTFILVGGELGRIQEIEERLEMYKNDFGLDYYYTLLKSNLENQKGNKQNALLIINTYIQSGEKNIELLLWKFNFEYNLGIPEYKETLKVLYKIGKKTDFKKFSLQQKIDFLSGYQLVNLKESLVLTYKFLQKYQSEKERIEFLKIFFSLFLQAEQEKVYFSSDIIDENSIITLQNTFNQKVYKICLDGYTKIEFGVDKVFKNGDNEYIQLIGKKKNDEVINIFGESFGIDQKYSITNIEQKYTHLQKLIFSKYTGDVLQGVMIPVPEVNGETDFSKFFELIDKQNKKDEELKNYISENFTKRGLLTFGILNYFYGKSYFDIYYQKDFDILIANSDFILKENEEITNIVLDPSSIMSIFELGIQDTLSENYNLYIPEKVKIYFVNILQKENIEPKGSTTISSNDGKFSLINYSEDYHQNREKRLRGIVKFLKEKCRVLSSSGFVKKEDTLTKIFGREFYESYTLAVEKQYYFYTDDSPIRNLSKSKDFKNVSSFGSDSFIMYLLSRQQIDIKNYIDIYEKMIDIGFKSLKISSQLIYIVIIFKNINFLKNIVKYVKEEYDDLVFLVDSIIISTNEMLSFESSIQGSSFRSSEFGVSSYIKNFYDIVCKEYQKTEVDKILKLKLGEIYNKSSRKIILNFL